MVMVIGWGQAGSGCASPASRAWRHIAQAGNAADRKGGCTRGVSAERFETPLGGVAARLGGRGGNPPAPAFPRRGKRERGRIKLPCCRRRFARPQPHNLTLMSRVHSRRVLLHGLPEDLMSTRKPEFPEWILNYFRAQKLIS